MSQTSIDARAPLRRSRGRPKTVLDATRRKEIVAQALQIFRELGYARLTTDAVAARCRISKQTLYRLFPSKTDLIAAIIETHRESMIALPRDDDHLSLAEALDRIFFNDIGDDADRERFAFLQFLFVEAAVNPELDAISEKYGRHVTLSLVSEWIARQCALGRIEVPDVQDAARMLMDMVVGSVASARRGAMEWPGSERRRDYVRECIRVFLGGVATRPEPVRGLG
ncbi:TetR/AcrR family transcriptional regulator [Xanthobacter sp. DSM 24535]|uniref:TetR/AcrR family transcriptional regulator n=1 Tax=Roseixanthobacter psychrophilus TaxID=3119917 RepID=UPI003729E177